VVPAGWGVERRSCAASFAGSRRLRIGAKRVAGAWIAVAWIAAASITAGAAAAADRVTVSFRNEITSLDLLIALEEGYFAEQGLEVDVLTWNSSADTLPQLAQGRVDFTSSSPLNSAHINLIQRGARVRLVAARSMLAANQCGYASFVARQELLDKVRVDGVAALRGRRIGSNRAISSHYYWSSLLAQGGLTLADVDLRALPTPAMGEALVKGLVDAVVATEPNVFRMVSRGQGKLWKPVNDVLPDRQNTFLLFGRRLLDERPDLGRRVAAAMLKAARQYVEEGRSERNVAIVARRTKMDPDEVRQLCWPQWSRDGRIDPRGIDDFQRWALAQGLIDAPVPFSQLVDQTFLPGSNTGGAPEPGSRR